MSRRTTAALAASAVAAVTVAVAVAVTRHESTPKHDAIALYIKDVDGIQQRMRVQLTETQLAYRSFSVRSIDTKVTRRLAAAARSLRVLELRLAALPAPAPARRLRALLVALAHTEVGVAREVNTLASFTPRFVAVLRDVQRAGRTLANELAAIPQPKQQRAHGTKKQIAAAQAKFAAATASAATKQADAIDMYVRRLAVLRDRLQQLSPPEVVGPAYRAQVASLAALVTSGGALARELRAPKHANVTVLSRRFGLAARRTATVAAQEAEIAAIKSYNARVGRIGALQAKIRLEITRLQALPG